MKNPVFENISNGGKLLLLLGVVVVFALTFSLLGLLIGKWYLHVDLVQLATLISQPEGKALKFALFFQLLSQIGIFIIPAFIFGLFVAPSPWHYLKMDRKAAGISLGIITLAIYAILPFVNYLTDLNHGLHLTPPVLDNWIRAKEAQAQTMTEAFLKTDTTGGLIINLIIMAVVPAIGEEMLFRGVLQRLFVAITRNVHVGIFITAFLFSAFHMQFLGFLPRFALGIMLGYAFVMTNSLWAAIWLHFVNNASSVIVYYLHYIGYLKISMEHFGETQNSVYIIGSLAMTIWLFIMMYNKEGADVRMKFFEKG